MTRKVKPKVQQIVLKVIENQNIVYFSRTETCGHKLVVSNVISVCRPIANFLFLSERENSYN